MEYIKYTILFTFLIIAALYDQKYMRIPNQLVFPGIIIGFLWSSSFKEILMKTIVLIILFFFGMLHLMGMGDQKLWMLLAMFIGFKDSCYAIGVAAVLLLMHALIRNYKGSIQVLKIAFVDFMQQRKIRVFEQESYPFAPYIAIGAFVICCLRIGGKYL